MLSPGPDPEQQKLVPQSSATNICLCRGKVIKLFSWFSPKTTFHTENRPKNDHFGQKGRLNDLGRIKATHLIALNQVISLISLIIFSINSPTPTLHKASAMDRENNDLAGNWKIMFYNIGYRLYQLIPKHLQTLIL